MKDVREPAVMDPLMVRLAPYITTVTTDKVVAAFSPPAKRPTTFCSKCNLEFNKSARFLKYMQITPNACETYSLF